MVDVHVSLDTTVPPERLRDALTDFSNRRMERFQTLDPTTFAVHEVGDTWADVTEGSAFAGGVWERGRYTWSDPDVVEFDVTDSNAFQPGAYWRYRIRPDGRGGSHVELTVHRLPRTFKGRLLTTMLAVAGERVFRDDLVRTLGVLTDGDRD